MQLTLSTNTIIWKTRHLSSTIDLMFMINELVNNVINCETRFNLNQSSNHISIFITFTFEINSVLIRQKKHENASTSKSCAAICVYSSCCRHWISLNRWKSLQISFNRAFTKQSMQLCHERNSCRNRNRIEIKNASTSYRQRDANKEFDRRCAQNNRDKSISKRRTKRRK